MAITTKHELTQRWVGAMADGELPPLFWRWIDAHLHQCGECRTALAAQLLLFCALDREPRDLARAPLRRRILRMIDQE